MVRIMIIEDDEEMRSLLRDFLEEEGFETDSVSNGADALRKLSKDHFDLVITDIRMPGLWAQSQSFLCHLPARPQRVRSAAKMIRPGIPI